jgi:chemotaxis signal transduction protein
MNTSELIADDANAWLAEENSTGTPTDTSDRDALGYAQTYMLARLDRFSVVFPSSTVADIVIVSQSQVLTLPFYDRACLGVIYYNSKVVPLVSLRQVFGMPASDLTRGSLTVVRLSSAEEDLADLGLVVDAVSGSRSLSQLPSDLFTANQSLPPTGGENLFLFRPEIVNSQLWQPQRWIRAKSN